MKKQNSRIIHSPTDLVVFMESPFAAWMNRLRLHDPARAVPDEDSEEVELIYQAGLRHEAAYLESLKAAGLDVCEIDTRSADRAGATRDALRAKRGVIFQACLEDSDFSGFADFLVREADGSYRVLDTKLARRPKPEHLVQLCCYADMLAAETGVRPSTIGVATVDGREHIFLTAEFFPYYRRLRAAYLELIAAFDPNAAPPEPDPRAKHRHWQSHAERWLDERDHLIRVADISKGQVRKLHEAGITTLEQLATTELRSIPRLSNQTFLTLRRQAELQLRSRCQADGAPPKFEILVHDPAGPLRGLALLPPASKNDVWFDIEGFPLAEGGLEYLLGAVHLVQGEPKFRDWWAHEPAQEKASFEAFVDWVHARWIEDHSMHVYHYASYETTAMKRLMGRHGTREAKVDDLLRNEVFVDLYRVVRQGILFGSSSYSLKEVEKLYRGGRSGGVQDATGSVVQYARWLDSGQPADWRESAILKEIRDYNEDDCVSTWQLDCWLRERQRDHGIAYQAESDDASPAGPVVSFERIAEREELAQRLLATLPEAAARESLPPAKQLGLRSRELLAYLVEFHRRDNKPVWWAMFERAAMTPEELEEDFACLGNLTRLPRAPVVVKQSLVAEYRFDPGQDTKIHEASQVRLAHHRGVKPTIEDFDRDAGRIALKISKRVLDRELDGEFPQSLSLIPDEFVSPVVIEDSIARLAKALLANGQLPPALDRLLQRRTPQIEGLCEGAPLIVEGADPLDTLRALVPRMCESTIAIQGPPGSGKTYAAAVLITDLLAAGLSVGITSNSRKAIVNLLHAAHAQGANLKGAIYSANDDDPVFEAVPGLRKLASRDVAASFRGGLVAGTAWLFARKDMAGLVDFLFIDEAGQVSLANVAGMAPAARNLVLIGDQMQLAQPSQGIHPDGSGESCLNHLLAGHVVVPPQLGIFLDSSRRMHPGICAFISDCFYAGQLRHHPSTECQSLAVPAEPGPVAVSNGILFHPVPHIGNIQSSEEEAAAIEQIAGALLGRTVTGPDGQQWPLTVDDILFVAPYNMQVRLLARTLPRGARIGSVDKFQGQEAPVVIVSLCCSAGEFGPRGLGFILDRNRMNVAISRARALTIIVGDPAITSTTAGSIDEMRMLATYCRIVNPAACRRERIRGKSTRS